MSDGTSSDEVNHKMDDLKWIRVFSPMVIPRYLVEQVRDRDFDVDDYYTYQEINCLRQTESGHSLNPLSHLYVLSDKENIIKGFLWFTIEPLGKNIIIQTYSIDAAYWNHGYAVKKLSAFMKEILRKSKLNKIYWVTAYPKHSKRYGFKESENVLMEYSDEKSEEKQETVKKGE